MTKPVTAMKFYAIDELPDDDLEFIMNRKNHRYGAETIVKPLVDGQLVSVGVAYQFRTENGHTQRNRAGITATRRSALNGYGLVQLPFDAWSVSNRDFQVFRKMQMSRNLQLNPQTICSLSDQTRRVDTKVHECMTFQMLSQVFGEEMHAYLEHSQGGGFLPWQRPADAGLAFSKPGTFGDRVRKMREMIRGIADHGGGIQLRRSFEFNITNPSANDNDRVDSDEVAS